MQLILAHNIYKPPPKTAAPRRRSKVRVFTLLHSAVPLLGPTVGLVLGQIAGFFGYSFAAIASLCALALSGISGGWHQRTGLAFLIGVGQGLLVMHGSGVDHITNSIYLSGTVISEPRYPKGEQITFTIEARNPPRLTGKKFECRGAVLPWLESNRVNVDSEVIMRGNVTPYSAIPWSYDWSRRINGFSGECKFKQLAAQNAENSWLLRQRQLLKDSIRSAVGDNERAGLLLSTAFGFRDQLSLSTEEIFRRAGLSHVLVASGYQVGLIFIIVFTALRKISVRSEFLAHSPLIIALKWTLPGIAAVYYTGLIGAESSAIRAAIAVIIQLLALAQLSAVTQLGTLISSIFLLSLITPGTILAPGTQLTYGALVGIMLGSSLSHSKTLATILVAICAGSITGAVSIIWFNQFSLLGPLTNIILAPVISVVSVNGSLLALSVKLISPSLGDTLLRFLADALIGLLEIIDYAVPSWALLELESESNLVKITAVLAALTPALVMLFWWTRQTLSLFDGVILRKRR